MDNTCTVIIRRAYLADKSVTFNGVTDDELEILINIIARTNKTSEYHGDLEMLITPD